MTAFAEYEDYCSYMGQEIEESEFYRYALRASQMVDNAAFGRISARGLDHFTTADAAHIKQAACAQIEFLVFNGLDAASGQTTGSYSIGKTSVTTNSVNLHSGLCPAAVTAIAPTGLLYSGVNLW